MLKNSSYYIYQLSIASNQVNDSWNRLFTHAVLLMDPEGRVRNCNKIFLQEGGWNGEEDIAAWFQDEWGDSLQEALRSFEETDEEIAPFLSLRSRSGRRLQSTVEYASVEWCGQAGWNLLHLLDIMPGGSLTVLQHFAGTLMRDINLGVILFDTRFILIDISDMACRVLGLERQAVLGQSLDDIFALVPEEHRLVQRTIWSGNAIRNRAVSWTVGDNRFDLLLDTSLLRDEHMRTVGGYVMFKDVTNLRSLEEQVQRSDRLAMIGQIAAGTAHEIRNPLTSIKGFLQVLRNTFITNGMEREHGYANIMLTEIDRINELVSEFLLLSKRKNVMYDRMDVTTVMREILPIIEGEATLHNVSVDYVSQEGIPWIVADRELLKQVFLNISKNGIEAMGDGGLLTISMRVDPVEHHVLVDIHDTGAGIPHFVMDKIFDPFFTTKEKGTGLGLSVCQRIIHDMGGDIRVSSKGFGTTFTVNIPYS